MGRPELGRDDRLVGAARPVPLATLLMDAVAEAEALGRGVTYDVRVTPPGLVVTADPARLHQLVANLLDNASRHSPSGGSVVVRAEVAGQRYRIEVRDSGPGIPAADRERVFEPFGTLAASAGTGSTGLVVLGIAFVVLGGITVIAIQLWNRVFRMGRTGQSLGKRVMGIRLVEEYSGQPMGAGMCFVREIAHALDGFFYLGYLWPLWDPKRQTFADKILSTVVVQAPKS